MRDQQKVYRDILDSQVNANAYYARQLMNPYYQSNSSNSNNQNHSARNNNNSYNYYSNLNPGTSNQQDEMLSAKINILNPNMYYNNSKFFC